MKLIIITLILISILLVGCGVEHTTSYGKIIKACNELCISKDMTSGYTTKSKISYTCRCEQVFIISTEDKSGEENKNKEVQWEDI